MMFNLKIPTNVLFGFKSRDRVFEFLDQNNWENIGVVIDGNLRGLPLFEGFIDEISQRKNLVTANCEISDARLWWRTACGGCLASCRRYDCV